MAELSGSVSNASDEELLLYLHANPLVQENGEGKKTPVVQLPTAKVRKKNSAFCTSFPKVGFTAL